MPKKQVKKEITKIKLAKKLFKYDIENGIQKGKKWDKLNDDDKFHYQLEAQSYLLDYWDRDDKYNVPDFIIEMIEG